ncbi:aminoglycoside phosphotransferase family protein [Halobacillus litoralis]|uniref:aminoglycoside phosphotransferase family protein n=1 Tax=Halobacillus litoralis TaxID=45668 RepID=UPI001CD6E342|nr:aminoglycoside phosphotransferase family protein [Halobacillus litoralis]MCA0969951.1 aminoglycoside phosphotransferase family protein [Halobacillus litoralis]
MRSDDRKGDSYTDRLFHWLKTEQNLPITLERTIKPKVYQVRYKGKRMILKGYRRPHILTQQLEFFNHWNYAESTAARPLPFDSETYTKSKLGCEWGLFEWVEGRHAHFGKKRDQDAAIHVLRQFHRTTKGIAVLAIPKDPLYIKWERRLEQFEETRDVFYDMRRMKLFNELRTSMMKQLEKFANHPWGEVEEKAWENHEWLHGDVAHHNFMIDDAAQAKMIDFDLLHTGPFIYDYIQLGQRFLPYFYSKPADLLTQFEFVDDHKLWLQGVHVPADLLREWLFGYRKSLRGETSLSRHIRKLDKAWSNRKMFVQSTESML